MWNVETERISETLMPVCILVDVRNATLDGSVERENLVRRMAGSADSMSSSGEISLPGPSEADEAQRRSSSRRSVKRLLPDADFMFDETQDPFEADGDSDEYRPDANPKRRPSIKRVKSDGASGESAATPKRPKAKPKPKPKMAASSTSSNANLPLLGIKLQQNGGCAEPRKVSVEAADKKRRFAERLSAGRSLAFDVSHDAVDSHESTLVEGRRLVELADPEKIGSMGEVCSRLIGLRRHFLAAHRRLAEAESRAAAKVRAFAAAHNVRTQLGQYKPLEYWLEETDEDCVIVVDAAETNRELVEFDRRSNHSNNELFAENANSDGDEYNSDGEFISETAKHCDDMNVTDSEPITNESAKAMLEESSSSSGRLSPVSSSRRARRRAHSPKTKIVDEMNEMNFTKNELFDSDHSLNDGSQRSPRNRSLLLSSESDESNNSDNIITVASKKRKPSKKGRKAIRRIISNNELHKSTYKAIEEERKRLRRIAEKENLIKSKIGNYNEIILDYDFTTMQPLLSVHPGFLKVLKTHQIDGIKFMWQSCFESVQSVVDAGYGNGCILAHCMGLGKTLQVIALIHTVITSNVLPIHKVLVCCPLSVVLNWVDEFHKWLNKCASSRSISIYEISRFRKNHERGYLLEEWNRKGGVLIIGYEMFRHLTTLTVEKSKVEQNFIDKVNSILLDPGPDIVVCDEGHLLKNSSTILATAMCKIVTKRRIVLTGTPLQNNLKEYYHMINFVKPSLLGNQKEFSNRFIRPITNGQHKDSTSRDIYLMKKRSHVLHKMLEGSVQRKEATVLYNYLPAKQEYVLLITLSDFQASLYKMYLDHIKETPTNLNNRSSLFINFHMFQKIWTHPKILLDEQSPEWYHSVKQEKDFEIQKALEISHKFVVALQLLDECIKINDKVVIFFSSLYNIDIFEHFLGERKGWKSGREYYRLDGNININDRKKLCQYFNSPKNNTVKLFLVSARVGSLGVSMIGANRLIIMDVSWNPSQDVQSIFRTYRFGQKKECFIYRLVANGTMEEKIYERSVTKQAVSRRVVDEEQIDRHYDMAELAELYSFSQIPQEVRPTPLFPKDRVLAVTISKLENCSISIGPIIWSIHEHDSLLRNIDEEQLNEDERRAAWLEYEKEKDDELRQNEQANNIQNAPIQIASVSSLALNLYGQNISEYNSLLRPGSSNTVQRGISNKMYNSLYNSNKDIVCYVPVTKNRNKKHFIPLNNPKNSYNHQRSNLPKTTKPQNTSDIAETPINVEEYYSYILPNGKIVRKSPKKTPKKITNENFSTIDLTLTPETPKSNKGKRSLVNSRTKEKSMSKIPLKENNTNMNFARRLDFLNPQKVESLAPVSETKTNDVETMEFE